MSKYSNVETIVFNGVEFRRYPDADAWADRMYFTPGSPARKAGIGRLHQEIWKAAHGPIPPGHQIHHRNGNALDNSPDNLECVQAHHHHRHHGDIMSAEQRQAKRQWVERIRPLASAWHRSEDGRRWHRELGRRSWEGRGPQTFVCERCGQTYRSRAIHGANRFCSDRCRAAARRASGVDDVVRHCERCGAEFTVNRYAKTSYCSRQCSTRHWREERGKTAG